jgi:hypothetical protein
MVSILLLILGLVAFALPSFGDDGDENDNNADTPIDPDAPTNEIRGTFVEDLLNGTAENDSITAFTGNDTIFGGDGVDRIEAGFGDDLVYGGADRDLIQGREGDDTLFGDDGNDLLEGRLGDDLIYGGYGKDVIRAGSDNDTIFGGFAARLVGDEYVKASDLNDTLRGEGGEDVIYIWGGDPAIAGKEGGFASGGNNEDNLIDEKDEIILVAGEARLEDNQGTADFIALANLDYPGQTVATITEFKPNDHRLVLTVDAEAPANTLTTDFTLEQTMRGGVNGVLVTAVLTGPHSLTADQYEGSQAFFRGAILGNGLGEINAANIDVAVVQTNAAETNYFDPVPTVTLVKSIIPANPASI